MSFEDEVRSMLVRRADDVSVGEAEWQRLVARLEAEAGVAGSGLRSRAPWLLAAAAVVVVVVGALALLVSRADEEAGQVQVVTPPPTTATTTTVAPAPPVVGELVGLYPAQTTAELEALEAEARAGARDDLTDPRAVAGAYVRERLGPGVAYSVSEFQEGDSSSGEVPYHTTSGGSGTVLLRRFGSIWYVTGVNAGSVAVGMASYDGVWTGGEAEALVAGRLQVSVDAGEPGSGDARDEVPVRRGQRIDLSMEFPGHAAVVLRVRFVGEDGAVEFGDYLLPSAGTGA